MVTPEDDQPRSVLVVDDDDDFRHLALSIVHSWGHEVSEAATVASALQVAAEVRPDTVLADVGLPDGDGFELARRLVAQVPQVRVVLISSDADAGAGGAAERAGALGFFAKDKLASRALRDMIDGR